MLSPKGDRIAWITEDERVPNWNDREYFLWISNKRGGEATLVGRTKGLTEMADSGERWHWPQELRWTPSGSQLSFRYRNAVWTVPVS